MTLLEATEPLFQYVCRLNRLARRLAAGSKGDTVMFKKGASAASASPPTLDYAVVRSEVKALFEDMLDKGRSDRQLAPQLKQLELPLLFFIDSMISESALPFAAKWNEDRLAYARKELAGDQKFFDLLEGTLKDPSDEASERLAVYFTCLGLGFTGFYFNQPEYLRKTMLTIAPRIRRMMDADQTAKVCPEAYEHVDTRDLVEPPGARLIFVGIVFACFALAVVISYAWMYHSAAQDLRSSLVGIELQDPGAAPRK